METEQTTIIESEHHACGFTDQTGNEAVECTREATTRIAHPLGATYLCDYHAGMLAAVFAQLEEPQP